MTDKLSLYNGALAILGEVELTSLTEDRAARYKLDEIWDRDLIRRVLKQGQWNFATRAIQPAVSTTVTPSFGYENAFEKPADWVRTTGICEDEYFTQPLIHYQTEGNYWFADLDVIYIRYVSDGSGYGGDFSLWTPDFTKFTECYLATEVAPRLAGMEFDMEYLKAELRDCRLAAQNTDAMEQPTKKAPPNSWVRSRWGNTGGDRGSRSKLIG